MARAIPTDVDLLVGMRIRECRTLIGLSQQQFAELIGVTSQQVYKYERGINCLSSGRLYQLAQELNTAIGYFFEGLEEDAEPHPRQRMVLDVIRSLRQIENEEHRQAIGQLIRTLAGR